MGIIPKWKKINVVHKAGVLYLVFAVVVSAIVGLTNKSGGDVAMVVMLASPCLLLLTVIGSIMSIAYWVGSFFDAWFKGIKKDYEANPEFAQYIDRVGQRVGRRAADALEKKILEKIG